jgi:hypothetical protein
MALAPAVLLVFGPTSKIASDRHAIRETEPRREGGIAGHPPNQGGNDRRGFLGKSSILA